MFSRVVREFRTIGLRGRLALLFCAVLAGALGVYTFFFVRTFVVTQRKVLDSAILNVAVDMAVEIDGSAELTAREYYRELRAEDKVLPFALVRTFVQVRARGGAIRFRSRTLGDYALPLTDGDRDELRRHRHVFRDLGPGDLPEPISHGASYRLVSYLISALPHEEVIVQVAAPTNLIDREARSLRLFWNLTTLFVVVTACLGAWLISEGAVIPLRQITRRLKSLSPQALDERVPVPEAKDEVRELAEELNRLLQRLEEAFRSQDAFVADASHQMKTPLTVLQGEIDLMRRDAGSAEFLSVVGPQVGHLRRLVENLLVLARLKGEAHRATLREDDFERRVLEAMPGMERLAASRGQSLRVDLEGEGDFRVRADGELLRVLAETLVENALKFSPAGKTVTVRLAALAQYVELTVLDEGPGISEEERRHIFDRFFRGEAARGIPGSGLGLSIVNDIVNLHGALIEVRDGERGGTVVRVRINRN